jgi:uncharacterized protein YicC (UPF0701 family)
MSKVKYWLEMLEKVKRDLDEDSKELLKLQGQMEAFEKMSMSGIERFVLKLCRGVLKESNARKMDDLYLFEITLGLISELSKEVEALRKAIASTSNEALRKKIEEIESWKERCSPIIDYVNEVIKKSKEAPSYIADGGSDHRGHN